MMQEANLIDGNQHGKETAKRDALRSRKRSHSPDAASPQPAAAHAKLLMPAVTGSRGTSQDQQREDYVQVQRRKYQQHMQQEVGQGAVQAPAQPNNATHPSVQQRQAVASTSRSHHGSKLTSQQHSSVSQGRMQQPAASQPPAYTNLGNGWIEWRQDRDINTFLAQKPPSSTSSSEAAWICVRNPAHRDPMELDGGGASCDLQRLLGQARAALSGSGSVQAKLNVIDRVAVAGKCTSGKWMVFSPGGPTTDAVWGRIADAVAEGRLGSAAKISTYTPGQQHHVICVYTDDYMNQGEVQRVRKVLRDLGHTSKLYYKPDIYTHLGIYSRHPSGVPATRYQE